MLRPHSVFFSGSSPIDTLLVSGFSFKYIRVPPSLKSFEKSYAQFMPNIVLRCMLNTVLLSIDTFTGVPASRMLWLMTVTVPMV